MADCALGFMKCVVLGMVGRPLTLCYCPLQSSILEWVHVVLLHLEQSSASQTAAGRQWLGDLDWPGFSIRASWSQTDRVGMATLIEGTKNVGHLNLEPPCLVTTLDQLRLVHAIGQSRAYLDPTHVPVCASCIRLDFAATVPKNMFEVR